MGSKQAHLLSCKVFSELHLFLLPVQKEQVATFKHSSVIHQLLINLCGFLQCYESLST